MHDIRWIRENPQAFDEGLKKRGAPPESARLLEVDERRRAVLTRLQDQQARRNEASRQIGKAKASGDEALAGKLIVEVAGLKEAVQQGEEEAKELEQELHDLLAAIANLPADDVPVGADEEANVELKDHRFSKPPAFDFAPRQHFELGEQAGLMDFETAARLSGARFVVLKGAMARLERAIAQFMLDLQTAPEEEGGGGYTEINPPLMVRDEVMFGTAQLPKFEEDQFFVSFVSEESARRYASALLDFSDEVELKELADNTNAEAQIAYEAYVNVTSREEPARPDVVDFHFTNFARALLAQQHGTVSRLGLIPTAEVPLTNLVRESILDEAELPLRFTAFTPCFRAEAGSAGRDTRGMIRQHQFEKVELVSITTPEQSEEEHERMLACAERVLKRLELPFRVMTLSTGDMGFAARKTYDIEVWLPGQDTYREISSCSNCGDFQARRMNARYRPEGEKQVRHVHTLNGSGLAVGRTLVAILENYQNGDGSVRIPEALLPYMGGITRIEPAAGAGEST